jgi:hypothetical protein
MPCRLVSWVGGLVDGLLGRPSGCRGVRRHDRTWDRHNWDVLLDGEVSCSLSLIVVVGITDEVVPIGQLPGGEDPTGECRGMGGGFREDT